MKKCLIADNNLFYLEFFNDLMSDYGYEVVKAYDGLEALEISRKDKFDLFIFDYVMPKIDGFRLSKYIKTSDNYKNTPIILITAAALESISWEENELFADIVVAKGPLKKMKDIFSEIIPNLEKFTEEKSSKIFGLEDIYPRQIVKELLKVEVHHSAIFENLVEGVAELDEKGNIIFANKSFLKLIGKTEEEIIGYSLDKIIDFDKVLEFRDAYRKVYSMKTNIRENVIVNLNERTIHFSLYNIVNDNNCTGVFIIGQDVTSVRKKVYEIGTLFNITQAFLSNLPYNKVLEYVIYEMRRLIKAINVTLLLSCEGFFKGAVINAVDRKLGKSDKAKIEFWVNKIKEWKEEGLISTEAVTKINKIRFENLPILWFPLFFQGKYLGTLLGFKNYNNEFDDESIRFFEAIGNQIAVYLANIEFFSRLSNFKSKEEEIRKEIETVVKKEHNNWVNHYHFHKWNSRNKKMIVANLLEELNSNLSILRGYGAILTAVKDEDKHNIGKELTSVFYTPLHKILTIKDDLSMLNKIGVDEEESNFHFFSISDLAKKVMEFFADDDRVVLTNNQSTLKKIGDFEKLSFLIKMLIKALLKNGVSKLEIGVEEGDSKSNFIIVFKEYLQDKENKINEMIGQFKKLENEDWIEIDDEAYFFYTHLKMFMKMLNCDIKVDSQFPYRVSIQFI
jgi:PAS domain S-box-containing protein